MTTRTSASEVGAADGEVTFELGGAVEAEGTVDSVMVGDTGEITASGEISPANDSDATPQRFELTGNCA